MTAALPESEAARLRLPPGFQVKAFASVGSTNDEAKALARAGAGEGTIVWARRQESGRGRRGRAWTSPEGNLYSSTILRPGGSPAEAAQISFVAALAIAETAESVLPDPSGVRCKWPNDVLVRDRKLSGILLESEPGADGAVGWLVLGVGINLRHFPDDAGYAATSLTAEGAPVMAPSALLEIYAGHLAAWYGRWRAFGFGPVRDAWLARARGLGGPILVRLADRTIPGTFADLDSDGVLLLDPADGGPRQRIAAGDVFFAPPPAS
ncbi:biotin--[acetyl-CoA-carboxylase] ligase [Azospirillum agricola]|uniref:biotin--[acetyl-CoA-carboxylase] ligase n=1 Tax=Azospirillum agricola TaxID=1720247 RepID=UPI000A0F3834|nr:biotin--[acetyl-CoA-carboxylase] ligase [Azospirillum agricola]SMH52208.1 BirA family transcriptional regulator, biotin operon repressor / biotin-[acetyl-CoA-carboxylase] ligase [Azospirillum lipoferum]